MFNFSATSAVLSKLTWRPVSSGVLDPGNYMYEKVVGIDPNIKIHTTTAGKWHQKRN